MTCTHCQAETADGIYLCDPHEGDLFTLLGVIPDTLADAQDTVARLDTKRGTGRGRPSTAPANLEAMQRVTELGDLLVSWSRLVYEVTGEPGDAGADYLRRQLRAIVGHDWAGDMLGELDRAHRRVIACVDLPPDAIDLGECGNDDCRGRIHGQWSKTPDGGRRVSESARCRSCRARYNGREVYALQIARTHGQLRGLRETERLLKSIDGAPSRRTIRRWIDRKMLRNWGTEAEPQVEPAAILTIMRQMERGRVELT